MNVLVVSDIHGNAPALRAVLEDADGEYSQIVCLGDIVGVIPFNDDVVKMIRNRSAYVVRGNHDARCRDDCAVDVDNELAVKEQRIVKNQLNGTQRRWLCELMDRIETPEFMAAHARPIRLWSSGYGADGFGGDPGIPKRDYTRIGPHIDGKCCFLGHTHYQSALSVDDFPGQNGLIVNPGSVGQPWDGEAEYAIVDVVEQEYDLRSIEYDTDEIPDRLDMYGLPTDGRELKPSI